MRRFASTLKLSSIACLIALLAGCPPNGGNSSGSSGTSTSPGTTPTPTGQTLPLSCPGISDPSPSCPGVALTDLKLTCSGAITATFDSTHTNRIGVTIPNGSTVMGNVRGTPGVLGPGEVCHGIGAKLGITITFGGQYIGDLGPNAPLCIVHSKLTFTQFQTSGSIFNGAWDPTIKAMVQDKVHLQIDQAVVNALSTPAPGSSPRCANFVELP
jgi:hypothetical protein